MTHRPEWTIYLRNKRPAKRSKEYTVKPKEIEQPNHRSLSATQLRRLADAMQDAVDGNYGTTHNWSVTGSAVSEECILSNGRLEIQETPRALERLVETIDNLLEE